LPLAQLHGEVRAYCQQGHLALASSRDPADFLACARASCKKLHAPPESEVRRILNKLERAAQTDEPLLVAGYCAEDLGSSLLRAIQSTQSS
jgi:hypothetical protein